MSTWRRYHYAGTALDGQSPDARRKEFQRGRRHYRQPTYRPPHDPNEMSCDYILGYGIHSGRRLIWADSVGRDVVYANSVLQRRIGSVLKRPVGRPPHEVRRYHASFGYQA
jgi:hypothetical protein